MNRHKIFLITILTLLLIVSFICSLLFGSVEIPLTDMNETQRQILLNIRLPRTIVAMLIGMNLSLSGAILQAVMKNPLADPHIIGISSGAGLFGIFVMLINGDSFFVTPSAFIGAMFAALLIYILAWKNGIQPLRIILAGVAVSAFFGAGISALLIFFSEKVHSALMFMIGGLSARSWSHVQMLLPYSIFGSILTLLASKYLNVLLLGDDVAKSLGLRINLVRTFLIAIAALLAASSVSVVGLLGFIGLIVPHSARLLIGSDYKFLLPTSALLGSLALIVCDTFARTLFAPIELPVGILTALIGTPFFLFLLRRHF